MPDLSITWPVWMQVDDIVLQAEADHHQAQFQRWKNVQRRPQPQQQHNPNQQLQQGPNLGSFTTWLGSNAARLRSFTLEVPDVHRFSDAYAIWAAFTSAATTAAAAGSPLPLQELRMPLQQLQLPSEQLLRAKALGHPKAPPAALLAALPGLQRLCMPLELVEPPDWDDGLYWEDPVPGWEERMQALEVAAAAAAAEADAVFKALPGLRQLESLEIVLRPWQRLYPATALSCWQRVLEAAPKQLRQLSFCVFDCHIHEQCRLKLVYNWAPLMAFTRLRRLRLDGIAAEVDLAPLMQLPALKSFSTQQQGPAVLEPLLAVKVLLQELEVGWVPPEQQQHLEQLTRLTSLTLTADTSPGCPLPVKVAAGLQRLDWTLEYDSMTIRSSSSSSGGLLAGCSSANLRDLQLRGQAWDGHTAAAEAVKQLTGLTAFGLHSLVSKGGWGREPWLGDDALQPLRQLRSLTLPHRCLNTQEPFLGQFPHLTRLCLAVIGYSIPEEGQCVGNVWLAEELLWQRRPQTKERLLANLRSCSATLKMLEVDLMLHAQEAPIHQVTAPYAPAAARAALQQELPGVYVLVRGHVMRQDWDWWYCMSEVDMYNWEPQMDW